MSFLRLWELLYDSDLSAREFASALGLDERTVERHLAGRRPGRRRASWYRNVRRIFVDGEDIHIVVAYTAPTRKPFGWSRESRLRKKQARRSRHGAR